MSEQPPDDPFEDCELHPDAILGAQTFEDVLFTDETETPVNVLTGKTPDHSQASVDEARSFAAGIDSDTPQIALQASVETQIETASKPYTAAAFFYFKATGSLQRHQIRAVLRIWTAGSVGLIRIIVTIFGRRRTHREQQPVRRTHCWPTVGTNYNNPYERGRGLSPSGCWLRSLQPRN